MKILFFNTLSAVHGGAERVLYDTAVELLERGHAVSLVVAYDDRRAQHPELWPARVNRYYLPELIRPVTDRRAYDACRRSAAYRDGLRHAQDIIDIEAPDLIHVHNFPSVEMFADLRVGVPMVRTIHGYDHVCENKTKRLPGGGICTHRMGGACREICGFDRSFRAVRLRAENGFMKRWFRRLLPVSKYVREILVQNGFDPRRTRVVGNFTRMAAAEAVDSAENTVLFVGRMTPEKGLLELVRAAGETRSKPTVLAVGADEVLWKSAYSGEVIREAERRGVRLESQPWSSGADLRSAYRRARVVAFPSLWPEPFGLVGIEAMAQGKPVVAFDTGGVRDWLEDGRTGLAAPPGDISVLAQSLDRLMSDTALRERMGRAGREAARLRFAPDVYISRLLHLYREVIDESSADRSRRRTALRDAQCGIGVPV